MNDLLIHPLLRKVAAADRALYLLFTSYFKVSKVVSHRLASAKLLGIFGGNEQNIADDSRQMFVPPPGYMFNQNDLEGAEAVVVALLCVEGAFRDCVRLKIKIHNFVCVKIFADKFYDLISPAEVESLTPALFAAHPNYKAIIKRCKLLTVEYDLSKRTVHGANYQMGWKTFQATVLKNTRGRVVLSPAQCKRLLAMYFELFPEIKVYQALTHEKVKLAMDVVNLFGYEVKFIQRFTDELVRLAVSWGPQSTIGVLACLAAIKHQTYIEDNKLDWHLHNIVHDSCLQSAPEGEIVEAAAKLDSHMRMELTSPVDGWKFTIGVEKSIGRNWGKKSETNLTGLEVVA